MDNVRRLNAFCVYADLDDFNVVIDIDNESDIEQAMACAQEGFDEWHSDGDPADTLLERIEEKMHGRNIQYEIMSSSFQDEYVMDLEEECENMAEQIRQSTIDGIEVVRCKDCKHYDFDCPLVMWAREPDDYCSYGEKEGQR